jgi:hypothetical protein
VAAIIWGLCLYLVLQPRVERHNEALTIINTRIGELDVNHPPGHRVTIWYQNIKRGINVRMLVLPW